MKSMFIRATVAAVVAGTSVAVPFSGTSAADTIIPLPNGRTVEQIGDGTIVVTATGQSARLSPGMVSLPTTRNAWVSGTLHAVLKGENPGNGTIQAGYVVGCQVAVQKAGVDLNGAVNSGVSAAISGSGITPSVAPRGSVGSSGSLTLSAGSIGVEPLTLDKPIWPKAGKPFKPQAPRDRGFEKPNKWFAFQGDSGSLTWSDTTVGVDGCAGYAQARLYAYVTGQVGRSEGTAVLWGTPFTLG